MPRRLTRLITAVLAFAFVPGIAIAQRSSDGTKSQKEQREDRLSIPDVLREKHPELISLIQGSENMDNKERQYWVNILPVMPPDQIQNLREILENEKRLLAIDRKNEKASNRAGHVKFFNETDRTWRIDGLYYLDREDVPHRLRGSWTLRPGESFTVKQSDKAVIAKKIVCKCALEASQGWVWWNADEQWDAQGNIAWRINKKMLDATLRTLHSVRTSTITEREMIRITEGIFKDPQEKMREANLHEEMLKQESPQDGFSVKGLRLSWIVMESLSHAYSQIANQLRKNHVEGTTEYEIDACIKCMEALGDMTEEVQLSFIEGEENGTLLNRAIEAGDATECRRLTARLESIQEESERILKRYEEPIRNYQSELGRLAAAHRARRLTANAPIRTPMEIFIDDFASKCGLELSVESDQVPLTVAYGRNGPSVSVGEEYLSTSGKLAGGAAIELTKDTEKRKLFVQTEGDSMATYDLDDRSFGLSFPVAKYRLEYLGLNIVLRLRN